MSLLFKEAYYRKNIHRFHSRKVVTESTKSEFLELLVADLELNSKLYKLKDLVVGNSISNKRSVSELLGEVEDKLVSYRGKFLERIEV